MEDDTSAFAYELRKRVEKFKSDRAKKLEGPVAQVKEACRVAADQGLCFWEGAGTANPWMQTIRDQGLTAAFDNLLVSELTGCTVSITDNAQMYRIRVSW